MSFVTVKWTGRLNQKQKQKIVRGLFNLLQRTLGKVEDGKLLVIDEVSGKNWAKGEKDELVVE